jgi:hypothetical protein
MPKMESMEMTIDNWECECLIEIHYVYYEGDEMEIDHLTISPCPEHKEVLDA